MRLSRSARSVFPAALGVLAPLLVAGLAHGDTAESHAVSKPSPQPDVALTKAVCDRKGSHQVGELFAYNDVWGSYTAPEPKRNFTQCIRMRPAGPGLISARYEWNFLLSRGIVSYPHVTYGWDWYGDYSTGNMPQLVSQLKPLVADYDEKTFADHFYDVAFDIWLSKTVHPVRETLTKEVMIWVENGGTPQSRKLFSSPTIEGHQFNLYVGPGPADQGKWTYLAFIAKSPIPKAKLDVSKFLRYLREQNLLEDDEYVNGISFGVETSSGTGYMDIAHFGINNQ